MGVFTSIYGLLDKWKRLKFCSVVFFFNEEKISFLSPKTDLIEISLVYVGPY